MASPNRPPATDSRFGVLFFPAHLGRHIIAEDYKFDFVIADETAKLWYDSSPNQFMPERQWCVEHISPGETVVDCGAHHGMLSILFARAVTASGKVIAFEGLPSNARVIEENCKLNAFENVTVYPYGVSSKPGSSSYHMNFGNIVTDATATGTSSDVTLVRLDDMLSAEPRVDFIKIDVEGHELEVLKGGQATFARLPTFDLEVHSFMFADRLGMVKEMLDLIPLGKYRLFILNELFENIVPIKADATLAKHIAEYDNPHLFGVPIVK